MYIVWILNIYIYFFLMSYLKKINFSKIIMYKSLVMYCCNRIYRNTYTCYKYIPFKFVYKKSISYLIFTRKIKLNIVTF